MVPLPEQLVLKDVQSGQIHYSWPYTFLRRFGQEKVNSSFSFSLFMAEKTLERHTWKISSLVVAHERVVSPPSRPD